MGKIVDVKLKGMTFRPNYPANLYALHEASEARKRDFILGKVPDEMLPMVLIRDPNNSHDPNAVEVHAPTAGREGMIAFIPKELAAKLAPTMDRGDVWEARLLNVLIAEGHESNPGVEIRLERVSRAPDTAAN
jgi:hypothetical protein